MRLVDGRLRPLSVQAGLSWLVIVFTIALMLVLALAGAGSPLTRAELNDGGVWVTNTSGSEFSRFIKAVREQDSPGSVDSTDFDLQQSGGRVILIDQAKNTMRTVDPATMALGPETALPSPKSAAVLGGPIGNETVAITDPTSGNFWVLPFEQATSLSANTEPTGTAGPGTLGVVDTSGSAWIVDPRDARLLEVGPNAEGARIRSQELPRELLTTPAGKDLQIELTAVGHHPVILNRESGFLWSDGFLIQLTDYQGSHVQEPSADFGSVLVAAQSGLIQVDLDGGAISLLADPMSATSDPPAPVRVADCAYAAFVEDQRTMQVRACPGRPTLSRPLLGVDGSPAKSGETSALRFRVNRGLVVLNDERLGALWDPDDPQPQRLDTWDRLAELRNQKESDRTDDVVAESVCTASGGPNHKPSVVDDTAGARPGQPVIIDVLANDSDADCDVMAIANPTDLEPADGSLALVAGGRKLQFTPGDAAVGRTIRFGYTVTDGHRASQSSGTVKVRVSAASGANKPPQMLRTSSTVVESGQSVTYNVFSDFMDPDGDPLYLAAASVDGAKGTVRFSPDGSVTFKDGGQAIGRVSINLSVSDGRDVGAGKLVVEVRREGNLPPTARSDYARATVGETISVLPLSNDTDPNDDELRLVSVDAPSTKGLRVRVDRSTSRVVISATQPGSYQLEYLVADNVDDVRGRIRVDVTPGTENSAPVAMVDLAQIKLGQTTTVDALFNDFDPDNDVLAVTSAKVNPQARTAVEAVLVSSRYVKLRMLRSLRQPATVTYVLSDGEYRRTGTIIVRELREANADEAPTAVRDNIRVRPGGLTTIDVLANDRDPAGGGLSLASELVSAPSAGQARVNGTSIRFAAGDQPGRFPFEYRIVDSLGNRAIGRVNVQVVANSENAPPIAPNVSARVAAGGAVRIQLPLSASDPDGDPVVLRSLAGSSFGNAVTLASGAAATIDYQATSSRVGTDRIDYQICDVTPASRCTDGTVRVGVIAGGANSAPVTLPDRVKVRPGKRVGVAVLRNDSDPDGDQLSLVPDGLRAPEGLSPSVLGNLLVFTSPAAGDYSVTYGATDGKHPYVTGHLAIQVSEQAPLLAPVATDDSIDPATLSDGQTSVKVDVLANDTDPDGTTDQLRVEIPDPGQGAQLGSDGTVEVALTNQPRAVQYEVVDPDQRRGYGYILVPSVAGLAPKAIQPLPEFVVDAGKEIRIGLDQFVVDPDNGPGALRIIADKTTANPASQTQLVSGPTQLTYAPSADSVTDAAVIKVAVTDGEYERTIQIPVRITIPNRAAVFTQVTEDVEYAQAEPLVLDLQQSVQDPDTIDRDKAVAFSNLVRSGSAGISAALESNGRFTVSAGSAEVGDSANFTFQVGDARGAMTTGSAVITVVPTRADPPSTSPDTIDRLDAGATTTKDVVANDFDPFARDQDGGLTITDVSVVAGEVTAARSGTGSVSVTANSGFAGRAQIAYTVADRAKRQVDGLLEVYVWGPPSAPGAPTEISGRSTATSVTLDWAASSANAFSDDPNARSVTYELISGADTWKCPDSTCTVSGLTPGESYTFTAVAINDVGRSAPSQSSAAIVPDALPSAPIFRPLTGNDAFDDGSVSLAWSQPASDGSRITGYELQISPDSRVEKISPAATATTVTGLKNGIAYQFILSAINAKGRSASEPYIETPTALPGSPATVTPTADEGPAGKAINVAWEPASNGGDDAMTYEVILYEGDSVVQRKTDISGLSANLVGENGRTYRVGVTASNRKGSGPQTRSKAVTPLGAPAAVTGLTATATGVDGEVTLDFAAPTDTGGATQAGLTYEVDLGEGWKDLSGRKLTGLRNGTSYTIRVRATNGKVGPAQSVTATPYGPVPDPEVTSAKPSAKQVSFTWSAAANGLPIVVTTAVNDEPRRQVERSGTVTLGRNYDETFTIVVRACDSMNNCASTTRTASTDPLPPRPNRPSISAEKPGPRQIRFTWNATSAGLPITVRLRVDGGGWEAVDSSGSRTVDGGYSEEHSATVQSCDSEGRCEEASASARTDAEPPPPQAQIVLSKGAAVATSLCYHSSCAYVRVELINFPANACWTFDLDSDHGTFDAPHRMCTDGNGYSVLDNWWYYGFPGTNVYATVNNVSAPPLRW